MKSTLKKRKRSSKYVSCDATALCHNKISVSYRDMVEAGPSGRVQQDFGNIAVDTKARSWNRKWALLEKAVSLGKSFSLDNLLVGCDGYNGNFTKPRKKNKLHKSVTPVHPEVSSTLKRMKTTKVTERDILKGNFSCRSLASDTEENGGNSWEGTTTRHGNNDCADPEEIKENSYSGQCNLQKVESEKEIDAKIGKSMTKRKRNLLKRKESISLENANVSTKTVESHLGNKSNTGDSLTKKKRTILVEEYEDLTNSGLRNFTMSADDKVVTGTSYQVELTKSSQKCLSSIATDLKSDNSQSSLIEETLLANFDDDDVNRKSRKRCKPVNTHGKISQNSCSLLSKCRSINVEEINSSFTDAFHGKDCISNSSKTLAMGLQCRRSAKLRQKVRKISPEPQVNDGRHHLEDSSADQNESRSQVTSADEEKSHVRLTFKRGKFENFVKHRRIVPGTEKSEVVSDDFESHVMNADALEHHSLISSELNVYSGANSKENTINKQEIIPREASLLRDLKKLNGKPPENCEKLPEVFETPSRRQKRKGKNCKHSRLANRNRLHLLKVRSTSKVSLVTLLEENKTNSEERQLMVSSENESLNSDKENQLLFSDDRLMNGSEKANENTKSKARKQMVRLSKTNVTDKLEKTEPPLPGLCTAKSVEKTDECNVKKKWKLSNKHKKRKLKHKKLLKEAMQLNSNFHSIRLTPCDEMLKPQDPKLVTPTRRCKGQLKTKSPSVHLGFSPIESSQGSNNGIRKEVGAILKSLIATSPSEKILKNTSAGECSLAAELDGVLHGVVACVQVRSTWEDRSEAIEDQLKLMGATIAKKLKKGVTHLVFKDGPRGIFKKAFEKGLHIVSVQWIESCKQHRKHVAENLFPVTLPETPPFDLFKKTKVKRFRVMQPKDLSADLDRSVEKVRAIVHNALNFSCNSNLSTHSLETKHQKMQVESDILMKCVPLPGKENFKFKRSKKHRQRTASCPSEVLKATADTLSSLPLTQGNALKSHERLPTKAIVLTSVPVSDKETAYSIIQVLGGFQTCDAVNDATTHVICGEKRRTLNLLMALVRGCWIVSPQWVYDSLENGKWVDEEPYEVTDYFPAVKVCRLKRANEGSQYRQNVFGDVGNMYLSPSTNPPPDKLRDLIELAGGKVVTSIRHSEIFVGPKRSRNGKETKPIHYLSEQQILDCITHNEMLKIPANL